MKKDYTYQPTINSFNHDDGLAGTSPNTWHRTRRTTACTTATVVEEDEGASEGEGEGSAGQSEDDEQYATSQSKIMWTQIIRERREKSRRNIGTSSLIEPDTINETTDDYDKGGGLIMDTATTFTTNNHNRDVMNQREFATSTPFFQSITWMLRGRSTSWCLIIAIIILGLNLGVNAQVQYTCPQRSEISPCTCTVKKNGLDILCEFTDAVHINKAMVALKGKTMVIYYLKLRHNTLRKLQGFIFLGLDIRHLTIHNSTLAAVEETSLSSIGKGLTQLDVSQNSLSQVPSLAFKSLHHLLILNMNHNRISAIHARAFEGLDTLEILTLYENKISNIDSDAFRGLEKKLKRLNLGGNQLSIVPQKALAVLENLRKLEMQENQITKIQEGDFEGLRNLDLLGLAHNHLREIPAKVFSHLTLLNSLELEGNNINLINDEAFVGLEENLQYLRLGDNNLHTIPTNALRRLHRLRHLDLRSNNISVIAEDAFGGYGDSITFLNLQKNDIKQLPALGFENLNSLETLNLQNNKIQHISEEVMEPIVDTLRVVDITDNPLICDCELVWYTEWLKNLKGKDDEMMQKKRTVCLLGEHHEYDLQNLPLDQLGCVNKNMHRLGNNVRGNALQINIKKYTLLVTFGTVAISYIY